MKRLFVLPLVALAMSPVFAANETEEALEATNTEVATATTQAAPVALPKISGYLQTGYQWTNKPTDNSATSSFQAKRLRLIMDGNCGENIDFRLQIEAFNGIKGSTNGNGQKNIQVMDAFATWKIAPEFKIRAGQFYTPLGYENYDISPATLETTDFSDIVYNIACRNPYTYNFVDYGRDLGIMFIGDLFDSGKGFKYLHYDVALTNGQIPCKDDNNTSKDVYVSATIRPTKEFNIKATYTYGDMRTGYASAGGKTNGELNRFVAGAWYKNPTGLDIRAEYGTMNGWNGQNVNEQGAYALVGYQVGKVLPVVRWSWYMKKQAMASTYNNILVGATYQLTKNTKIQFNYQHKMYGDNNPGYKTDDKIQIMGLFKF